MALPSLLKCPYIVCAIEPKGYHYYDGMAVKDALNLAKFILHTTIILSSFEIGAPSCSEPIQTAVIDESSFEWIDKPTLKS